MAVINFKKRMMTFENQEMRVITPMDPNEGWRYIEPLKDEIVKGQDHAYNISEYYIPITVDGELGWCNASSTTFDSEDVLENWKNLMHEVSFRKCGLIMQSLFQVVHDIVELPIYEGFPKLYAFLKEFEEKVSEP